MKLTVPQDAQPRDGAPMSSLRITASLFVLGGLGACTPSAADAPAKGDEEIVAPREEETTISPAEVEEVEDVDTAVVEEVPEDVPQVYPASCQEVVDAALGDADGEFTLYVSGDPQKPWTAWCAGMPDQPTEYLTFAAQGIRDNAGYYPCHGYSAGTPVKTTFTRVAIDPATLIVDPHDFTFSQSTGLCNTFTVLTELPWGYAGSCGGRPDGRASIDLTGTPFVVRPDAFMVEGWLASGTANYAAGGRRISLNGGGSCGSMSPSDPAGIGLAYRP